MSGIILLSCGIFLTLAVAVNLRSAKDLSKNSSGTGGYNLFIKTSLPVLYDLNSIEGRKAYGLDTVLFKDVQFVQMSLAEGDEASCLNLNRVETPAVLGVDFAKFAERKAFTFTGLAEGVDKTNSWQFLKLPEMTGHSRIVSGVADSDAILWIMGEKIGNSLKMKDESGKDYNVRLAGGLAGSVFQGYVLIPEKDFILKYPSISGSRVMLVDCPENKEKLIAEILQEKLSGLGVKVETCRHRLNRFLEVENTYLSIFLALGGLGLILGAAGFGIVVVRNIIERQQELAIMHAIGFNRKLIRKIVTVEHLLLIILGTLTGGIAAAVSVIPAVISARAQIPWNLAFLLIAGILSCGILCVYIAAVFAVKKKPIEALRKE